jgi:hypothetical protein
MQYDIDNIFTFHPCKLQQTIANGRIRIIAHKLAKVILENTTPGVDQDISMKALRECVMFALASIELHGKLFIEEK